VERVASRRCRDEERREDKIQKSISLCHSRLSAVPVQAGVSRNPGVKDKKKIDSSAGIT